MDVIDILCDVQVWDREKIVLIPDHYIFTTDERANRNVDILRDFAHEQDIKYFYDITDRSNFRVRACVYVCHTSRFTLHRTLQVHDIHHMYNDSAQYLTQCVRHKLTSEGHSGIHVEMHVTHDYL